MVLLLLFVLATSGVAQAQSKPAATKPAPPAATKASAPPAPRKEPGKPSATATTKTPGKSSNALGLPARRPIVLDVLHVEGKTDAPRVLFVHAGPTVALEDAPTHPSYLRDDFTAALSSPVRVRVRTEPLRSPTAGGTR